MVFGQIRWFSVSIGGLVSQLVVWWFGFTGGLVSLHVVREFGHSVVQPEASLGMQRAVNRVHTGFTKVEGSSRSCATPGPWTF